MMSKEFLKKLGIVGITLGLSASPLAFATTENQTGDQEVFPEETGPADQGPGEHGGVGTGTDGMDDAGEMSNNGGVDDMGTDGGAGEVDGGADAGAATGEDGADATY